MATHLYGLGAWAFKHRRTVLAFWFVVLVAVGVLSQTFVRPPSTQFTIPGTQSQEAIDLLNQKFPAASGAAAQVVFAAPVGHVLSEPSLKSAVEASLARVKSAGQVLTVTDPFTTGAVSKDGTIALAEAIYTVPVADITNRSKTALERSAAPARAAGITVAFGGGVITPPGAKSSEAVGVLIAYVVLTITFGALLAAGLPLMTALIGVAIGVLGLNALGAIINLSSTAPILATMIGLAVGIDYAALHPPALSRESLLRARPPRGRGPRDRRSGDRGGLRRTHRGHCTHRAVGRQHPVPHRDGARRGRHRGDRRFGRAHVAPRAHGLRRIQDHRAQSQTGRHRGHLSTAALGQPALGSGQITTHSLMTVVVGVGAIGACHPGLQYAPWAPRCGNPAGRVHRSDGL